MLGNAVIWAIYTIFNIINVLIIINVFASWLPFLYNNEFFAKLLYMIDALVEPIMKPVRNLLQKTPMGNMPVDFSPIVVLLLLNFLQSLIVSLFA